MIGHLLYHLRRLAEYSQRYFYSGILHKSKKHEILKELFLEVNTFLSSLEIEYWLNYGNLLGLYRSDNFIGHDIDVDFGSREKYADLIWQNRDKLSKGFKMHDSSNRHLGPKFYISYKGFDADIYFYRETEETLISYEKTKWDNYNAPIPKEYIFPLVEQDFLLEKTFIPNNTEAYLKTIYGSLKEGANRNLQTGYWE